MVFVRNDVLKVMLTSVAKKRDRHIVQSKLMMSRFVYATCNMYNLKWNFTLSYLISYQPPNIMFIGIHETSNVIFHHFSLKSIINSLNIWYCFYVEKASHPPMYTHTHTHNKCQKIDKKNVILRMMHLQHTAHFYCEIYLML